MLEKKEGLADVDRCFAVKKISPLVIGRCAKILSIRIWMNLIGYLI